MNVSQIVRIAALLALIFASGVWTGRLTAPKQQIVTAGGHFQGLTAELALTASKSAFH
jgi:hypothetical protein